jgi:16S rRNA processing protein RimM
LKSSLKMVLYKKSEANRLLNDINIGQVIGVHGLKGELKLSLHPNHDKLVSSLTKIKLDSFSHDIVNCRFHKHYCLLTIKNISDRTQAESFRHQSIYVSSDVYDAFFKDDQDLTTRLTWIDRKVFNPSGEYLGLVDDILYTGSNDVLSVVNNGQELLVPVIDDVIVSVTDEQLVVSPLEEL